VQAVSTLRAHSEKGGVSIKPHTRDGAGLELAPQASQRVVTVVLPVQLHTLRHYALSQQGPSVIEGVRRGNSRCEGRAAVRFLSGGRRVTKITQLACAVNSMHFPWVLDNTWISDGNVRLLRELRNHDSLT
jgi:hypothetical protein